MPAPNEDAAAKSPAPYPPAAGTRQIHLRRPPAPRHAALFLDRDGTIIYDKEYLADPAGVELIPGAAAALRLALKKGYRLFLFTNQSGIGRGYYTLDDVHACNARMFALLGLAPERFTEIGIAPEAYSPPEGEDDAHLYRKPSPRFIREMLAKYALAPAQCWMVGDRESDIVAGQRAGVRTAAVATGKYTLGEWQRVLDSPAFRASEAPTPTEEQAQGPPTSPAPTVLHADLLRFVESLAVAGAPPLTGPVEI